MPIYEMTREKRKAYKQLIRDVRKEMKMTQAEFAQTVIQYSGPDSNGKYSFHVHRNSVQNWENDRNGCVPLSEETFISIALLKVRGSLKRTNESPEERDRCYSRVLDLYKQYMDMELHQWYLPNAVMIEAIRGIYSMEEVPEVIDRLKTMIGRKGFFVNSEDAMPGPTEGIKSDLELVSCDEDLVRTVEKYSSQFTFGYGVVGRRMQALFDKRHKSLYEDPPRLRSMVAVYAPRQRNSYQKIYEQVCSVSRTWLIDLCIHMRFSRQEINEILHAARYLELQESEEDPEYGIRDYEDAPLGSAAWYLEEEVERYFRDRSTCRYEPAASCSPREKAALLLLLAEYIRGGWLGGGPEDGNEAGKRYPIDYFLEYAPDTDFGKILLREIWNRLPATNQVNIKKNMEGWAGRLYRIIENGMENLGPLNSAEKRLYKAYVDEFENYYEMPFSKGPESVWKEGAPLHLFAALAYSVCTGDLWKGYFPPGLNLMEALEQALPPDIIDKNARILLYNVMVLMLGPTRLEFIPGKGVCFAGSAGKISFSMGKVADGLYRYLKNRPG